MLESLHTYTSTVQVQQEMGRAAKTARLTSFETPSGMQQCNLGVLRGDNALRERAYTRILTVLKFRSRHL